MPSNHRRLDHQSGIALLMVIFTITLLSILAISLSQSTYIGMNLHRSFIDRFRAELLLRSTVNVAMEIISQDQRTKDPPSDSWGLFIDGKTVPASILGIDENGLEIGLEITGENRKIPLLKVKSRDNWGSKWREITLSLFNSLGFDKDNETDHTGLFLGTNFSPSQMIGNLVDYLDADSDTFSDGPYEGIEDRLPSGYFPKSGVDEFDLQDLGLIPGFSPQRVKKLGRYVTGLKDISSVNVNLARPQVFQALDPSMTQSNIEAIIEFARGPDGPFDPLNQQGLLVLQNNLTNYQDLKDLSIIQFDTTLLQLIAKVEFGGRRFFATGFVKLQPKGTSEPPILLTLDFFG